MSYAQNIILGAIATLLAIGCITVAADDKIDDAAGRFTQGHGSSGYGTSGYGNGDYADSYKKLVQYTKDFHEAYAIELEKMIEKIAAIHEKVVHKKDRYAISKPQPSRAYPFAYDPNGRPFA